MSNFKKNIYKIRKPTIIYKNELVLLKNTNSINVIGFEGDIY